ncbi:tetratricopeptide repeat protein [Gemmatimonadota bacterium]
MPSSHVLEEIRAKLEGEYPLVLAQVVYQYRSTRDDDLGGRFKRLIDLFEALSKFLCIVALQDGLGADPALVDRLPQKEKTLDFLRRPSTGGWVGLLRTLCKLSDQLKSAGQLKVISQWYFGPRSEEALKALEALEGIPQINFDTNSKTPHSELFNALVSLRNKFGHGSMPRDERLATTLPVLEGVLAYLLLSADFLSAMRVIFIEKRELTDKDEWQFDALELNGHAPERIRLRHSDKLEAKDVYLCSYSDGQITTEPVHLSPFLLWVLNDELRSNEVYLYNGALRTKLEYTSPASGAFYYHKELSTDLQELLHLKLREGAYKVDPFSDYSVEQRLEKGEEYFKRARLLLSQNRLEDALEVMEVAIEYDRKADYLVARARIEKDLGDPSEVVEQSLITALELNPSDRTALDLLSEVRGGADASSERIGDGAEGSGQPLESPTIFHALTPRRFREYAPMWWLAGILLWFSFSFTFEALAGGGVDEFAGILGSLVTCIVFVLGLPTVRTIVLNLRYRLSLQLDKMRLERFEGDWYPARLRELFGSFVFRDGRLQVWQTIRGEKVFYWGYLATLVGLGALIMIASNSLQLPLPHLLKRAIDYFLVIITLYPCLRYVIMSTFFVLKFSKLSIKPMLSRINDDGLRSFSPFFAFNIFLATAANVSFFVGASFMNTGPIYGDLPILFGITLVVMVWSIGMPFTIYRAARSAKYSAVHTYASHLEDSFAGFLKKPGAESLERYEWLQQKQSVIRKISSWPLSVASTIIFLVGGNLLLAATNVWFIMKRTGLLSGYLEHLL